MIVGIAIVELHIHQARSLKEKRAVLKSIMERIHARFRVSIAETDYHDLHQRAEFSLAAVTRNDTEAERLLDTIRELVESEPACFVGRFDAQLLDPSP
jgi:uncharacterized protein YlxP (DUF503 family)